MRFWIEQVDNDETAQLIHTGVHEMLSFAHDMGFQYFHLAAQTDQNVVMPLLAMCGMLALAGAHKTDTTIQTYMQKAGKRLHGASQSVVRHHTAVKSWIEGDFSRSIALWDDLLASNPFDIVALKLSHTSYFFLGLSDALSRSIASVLTCWLAKEAELGSLCHFVVGMFSFGLEEIRQFDRAEKLALAAVRRNPSDIWSIHSLAHNYLDSGAYETGIAFLRLRENDWSQRLGLSCHVYWHLAVLYFELGSYEQAIQIFDNNVVTALDRTKGFALDIADAASLLWRLDSVGFDVGADRWILLDQFVNMNQKPLKYIFYDVHFMMIYSRVDAQKAESHLQFLEDKYLSDEDSKDLTCFWNSTVMRDIGIDTCRAFFFYSQEKLVDICDLLFEKRREFWRIGGSKAQRDIVNFLLILSTVKSSQRGRAQCLISERLFMNHVEDKLLNIATKTLSENLDFDIQESKDLLKSFIEQ